MACLNKKTKCPLNIFKPTPSIPTCFCPDKIVQLPCQNPCYSSYSYPPKFISIPHQRQRNEVCFPNCSDLRNPCCWNLNLCCSNSNYLPGLSNLNCDPYPIYQKPNPCLNC